MTVKKAGVMGWPVTHSLSPRLHSFWLNQYGIDGRYEPLPVDPRDIGQALERLREEGFVGVNLTMPHKEIALSYMAEIEPLAQRVGAVNTVLVKENGALEGKNTDVYGFSQNILEGGFVPDQRPAVILGAGGAARSAIVALMGLGLSEIRVANRTFQKAQGLANEFDDSVKAFAWNDARIFDGISLLANATLLGMKGQPSLDIDLGLLPRNTLVTDMVYAPLMTELLAFAAQRGNKVVDGLGMLLHQARPAFKSFFGVDPLVTQDLRLHVLKGYT